MLVEHLPPDGALARAVRGHPWTLADHHAADTVDVLHILLTAFLNVHREEKAPALPWPEPVWRPGDPTPEEKAAAAERSAREARAGYDDIVALAAPGRI